MIILKRSFFMAAVLFSALNVSVAAHAEDEPIPVTVGDVTYVAGGIGDEDREYMEAHKNDYNLYITNAYASGEYVGEVNLVIVNKLGDEVLNTATGPLLYAYLPKGKYVIEATLDGNVKRKNLVIGKTGSRVNFLW